MLLLVGLGNPGPEHVRNRHNIGFMAVDAIAAKHRFGAARTRFKGLVAEGTLGGRRTLILKPLTYMNLSGEAVGEAARYLKIAPQDIVVFHDELDLAAGKLRMKAGGGHAGHNGLRSLDQHLGPDYRRCRLGIGHPGDREKVLAWVLNDFAKAEQGWLDPLLAAIADAAPLLAEGKDAAFASRVGLLIAPPKPKKPAATETNQADGRQAEES
jgi:PTH1 family peptidyl-tRNA hydrolase